MTNYPALIEWDDDAGAYGVVFPDILGTVAMGETFDEALVNAEDSLRDYFAVMAEYGKDGAELSPPSALEEVEVPPGNTLVSISVASPSRNIVKADIVP